MSLTATLRIARRAPLALLALTPLAWSAHLRPDADAVGLIETDAIEETLRTLAAPGMEGRDSPSEGQRRAAQFLCQRFTELGLEPAADAAEVLRELGGGAPEPAPGDGEDGEDGQDAGGRTVAAPACVYLRPYVLRMEAPDVPDCALAMEDGDETTRFEFGTDFLPAPSCNGQATGEVVFAGFGITSKRDRYDDFKGLKLEGTIAVVFEGEPRHRKKFEGPEHTESASLWSKLELLGEAGAAGVLVVRRHPEGAEPDPDNGLDYRHTFASFPGSREPRPPRRRPPTLEISMECATRILGTDAEKLAVAMDRSVRPKKLKLGERKLRLSSATEHRELRLDNVVGIIPGSDPALAGEYVVLGAHYDHIGVDPRGRVGSGADDNASGTSALLAVTGALAQAGARRSILVCCFSAEEDGLVGARELCKRLPVATQAIIAMVNLDMIGRGDTDEVVALGTEQYPDFEDVLKRAKRLSRTGVKSIVTGKGQDLWKRSDHYAFHEVGIPCLFFFEGLPITRNKDYHTWRDVPDEVDFEKVTRTARLVFNTVWLLANDDDPPRRR